MITVLRLLITVLVLAVVLTVRLAVLVLRLGRWLLARLGFHGLRLVALAATVVATCWAAGQVGVRPAVWLAVIGWTAWAGHRHLLGWRQHAAARRLIVGLERHANVLAAGRLTSVLRPRPRQWGSPTGGLQARKAIPARVAATAAPTDQPDLQAPVVVFEPPAGAGMLPRYAVERAYHVLSRLAGTGKPNDRRQPPAPPSRPVRPPRAPTAPPSAPRRSVPTSIPRPFLKENR